jgi:hypothetical protein
VAKVELRLGTNPVTEFVQREKHKDTMLFRKLPHLLAQEAHLQHPHHEDDSQQGERMRAGVTWLEELECAAFDVVHLHVRAAQRPEPEDEQLSQCRRDVAPARGSLLVIPYPSSPFPS